MIRINKRRTKEEKELAYKLIFFYRNKSRWCKEKTHIPAKLSETKPTN